MAGSIEPIQQQFRPYAVQNLFSEHYLAEVLPQTALWDTTGMEDVRAEIEAVWKAQEDYVEGHSEAALEEEFIRPVLEALGHVTYVQPSAGTQTPDYAFFAGDDEKAAALDAENGGAEFWEHAIAVGDAKVWDRPLDKKLSATSGWDNQNPSFQIYHYLAETGCRWGILTNGRLWRIYPGQPKAAMDSYYEVDLLQALEADDPADFAYFFLFLRRTSFTPDEAGETFLDHVRDKSDRFAARLREDVRENVYDALRLACEGFLRYEPNDLGEDDLEDIHDNALVLLYRLLFILYAESAGLLPLTNGSYRDGYSLLSLKAMTRYDIGIYTDEDCTVWPRVTNLFNIVDAGREPLNVPAYNGGLFNADRHPFLEDHALPDSYIARVINLLAMDAQGRFVDYRDLGVRHLGSIYEGLLEYRVQVAQEPLVAATDNGTEVWEPAESEKADVRAGEVYLVTDRGERRATGSYYTPQYIVEYIVENTVGPPVEKCDGPEDILQLNVLDPAMGSGHFLVEATDFLARRAAEMEAGVEETIGENNDDESDLQRLKRQVVERCIYGVDLNPLAVELAKLSLWLHTVAHGRPLTFLDHHLRCGNSLIGADLEDIAAGVPEEKSRQQKEEESAGQLALFDHRQWTLHAKDLVFGFTEIEHALSESPGDIEDKERILEDLDRVHRKPYLQMADVWCSRYFGNEFSPETYGEVVEHLQGINSELLEHARDVLERGRQIAAEHRFLHPEFEFPEVFFTSNGKKKRNPGFDAVVGNPPYVRQEQLGAIKPYLQQRYEVYQGTADIYVYFFNVSLLLLRENGRHGFITSNKFMRANYGQRLREFLTAEGHVDEILDFGELPVFEDASTFPAILLFTKGRGEGGTSFAQINRLNFGSLSDEVSSTATVLPPEAFEGYHWRLNSAEEHAVIEAMELPSRQLGERVDISVYRGVLTGLNEAFIIDAKTRAQLMDRDAASEELIEPLVTGDHIRRYRINYDNQYLIFTRRGVEIDDYPAIKDHLSNWKDQLTPRGTSEEHGPGRKPGDYQWYEIQDTIAYYREFDRPKIIYPDIAIHPRFAMDTDSLMSTNTTYFIPDADGRMLALLNSTCSYFLFQNLCAVMGSTDSRGRLRFFDQYMERFPVRIIDTDHRTEDGDSQRLMEDCREAIDGGDYETPLELATEALATHAALHGPAGKPELAENEYWEAKIEAADETFSGREDFVHGLLGELARRMMELNETKHEIIERFQANLRGVAATDIHEDLDRGKQGRTLYKHECCRPYVEEGSHTTHSLHETLGWSAEAFEVFVKELCGSVSNLADMLQIHARHADRFREITGAVNSTDTLIDRIVYALYGLSEEQVAIVEESVEGVEG